MPKLIFATRASVLARWQTQWVISALQKAHPGLLCEERIISTRGDEILDIPLTKIDGKGLFTQELENELLSSAVHCAVHSLKDLPVKNPAGLIIGCIPSRAEVRDTLISAQGFTLATLPSGAHVGTCSLRRTAQVLAARPDLIIDPLRGNIDSRLRKALAGKYDAIILAGAGLIRLGFEKHVSEWLSLDVMMPAPGQGALAVQCRADDHTTLSLLAILEDSTARKEVTAERQFLLCLGGGCALPVAAYAQSAKLGISLRGVVASPDGRKIIHVDGYADDPLELGDQLARKAVSLGASQILSLASGDSL